MIESQICRGETVMRIDVNKLFEEIGNLSQVEAVALGGSRATGRNDEKSDYDVSHFNSPPFPPYRLL